MAPHKPGKALLPSTRRQLKFQQPEFPVIEPHAIQSGISLSGQTRVYQTRECVSAKRKYDPVIETVTWDTLDKSACLLPQFLSLWNGNNALLHNSVTMINALKTETFSRARAVV